MSRVVPGLVWFFGPGTLVVMYITSWDVPSCSRTCLVLWKWDFGSHVYNILGCPELFQDMFGSLDLGLW